MRADPALLDIVSEHFTLILLYLHAFPAAEKDPTLICYQNHDIPTVMRLIQEGYLAHQDFGAQNVEVLPNGIRAVQFFVDELTGIDI